MAVTYRYPVASLVPDGVRALVGLVVTGAPLAALSVAPWFGHQDAAWSEASPMGYHSSMDNRQVWPAVGYDAMALNTVEKEGKEWDVVRADILAPGGRQDR